MPTEFAQCPQCGAYIVRLRADLHETVIWCERGHEISNIRPYQAMPMSKAAFFGWLARKRPEGAADGA